MPAQTTKAQRAQAKRLADAIKKPARDTKPTSPLAFINEQMRKLAKTENGGRMKSAPSKAKRS